MTLEKAILTALYESCEEGVARLTVEAIGDRLADRGFEVQRDDIQICLLAHDGDLVQFEAVGAVTWRLRPEGQDRLASLRSPSAD
jgi:hypothetical protein